MLLFSPSMKLPPLTYPCAGLWVKSHYGRLPEVGRARPRETGRTAPGDCMDDGSCRRRKLLITFHQNHSTREGRLCYGLEIKSTKNKQAESVPLFWCLWCLKLLGRKNSILQSKKKRWRLWGTSPWAAVNMFIESKSAGDGSLAALTASGRC